jgi:hypothetical protein
MRQAAYLVAVAEVDIAEAEGDIAEAEGDIAGAEGGIAEAEVGIAEAEVDIAEAEVGMLRTAFQGILWVRNEATKVHRRSDERALKKQGQGHDNDKDNDKGRDKECNIETNFPHFTCSRVAEGWATHLLLVIVQTLLKLKAVMMK